jgi:hypothetical protein
MMIGKVTILGLRMGKTWLMKSIDKMAGQANMLYFLAKLVELNVDSRVGYVPLKLASQLAEDGWAAQRHTHPILTELIVLTGEAAEKVVIVDWNTVDVSDKTELVIAPISGIDIAKLFGIYVDDKHKENESDAAIDDGKRHAR